LSDVNQSIAVWLVVGCAICTANAPFLNNRLFAVGPLLNHKAVFLRLLELVLFWGLTLVVGSGLEASLGQRAPQGWEFFAASGTLFLTLGAPGFIWQYLRKRSGSGGVHV
jgi:hypothetical protein